VRRKMEDTTMSLQKPVGRSAPVFGISCVFIVLAVVSASIAHAQNEVLPGETATLELSAYSECEEHTKQYAYKINGVRYNPKLPVVNCDVTQSASGLLKVRAGRGAFIAGGGSNQEITPIGEPLRHGYAIGRIGNIIQIPEIDPDHVGSEVLAAQISTEVAWNGLLWNRRISIPSWTQVVATLQVRDTTDSEAGPLIASTTFLNERADLDSNLPASFGDFYAFAYGWTTVRNSSGVDLTAQLVRGRTYRIEVEAKCEDLSVVFPVAINPFADYGGVPRTVLWSGGGCFFSNSASGDALDLTLTSFFGSHLRYNVKGGFEVQPLTVTVQDDAKAKLAEILNRDSDQDGIPNRLDACPDSDLSPTVVIDACDSGVANTIFPNGCTLSDEIAKCATTAGNHGQFVACVAHLTNDVLILDQQGEGPWADKGTIQRCASRANIP
jgi:hypothetical protein